jgi:hypothetical protein
MGSFRCLYRPKQPARSSPASWPSLAAHRSIASSPNSGISLGPARVQCEVRHNTLRHIWTILGSSITCWPRRLTPDRLTIAKAEFDVMLRDGTTRRSQISWTSALHILPKKDNGWRP